MGAKTPGLGRSRAEPEWSKQGVSGYEPDSQISKPQRLQKILAHAGLGSRRDCEEYILQGRVTVEGKVVRELGTRVNSESAAITVDGERVRLEKMVYYAVNKPKGFVSTDNDPAGRPRVIDLLPEVPERVYAVGRLDEESMGLMILTNDGELA
ncbi:MAG TPA: S4 domain-containing protein, partial [Isosphaeraceae bacterium]|nr:S4 domain-containing protein [Isosphaeraceae bacterium]